MLNDAVIWKRMPTLSDPLQRSVLDTFTVKCRLATLVAYGVSLVFFRHAESLAEKVYDDLCSSEGIRFVEPTSVMILVMFIVVFSIPTLLARSRVLIVANLTASLITAGGAVLVLFTASDTPYECFTMGGDYEDHTSGLGELMLWGVFVLLLSFASLCIDLPVWAFKKVTIRSE